MDNLQYAQIRTPFLGIRLEQPSAPKFKGVSAMQEELIGKAMMTWLGVSSALLLQLPAENVFTSFSILFSASLFLKRYETLSNCHRNHYFYDFYDKTCGQDEI